MVPAVQGRALDREIVVFLGNDLWTHIEIFDWAITPYLARK